MWYQCHNSAIDERGQFYPREDPGTCSLIAYCEDDSIRYFSAPAAAKGTSPVWTQQMTINMITGAITPSQTGGIIGTTAANNANAGAVGELLTATIASPGTSLTTATPTNVVVAGLSLTAGDWDLWGNCCFLPAATTSITQLACGMSATTNTLPAAGSGLFQVTQAATVPTAIPQCFSVQPVRVSIASTTSWFMVAQGAFTVSTLSAFGTLLARRVR
jgi:hypothetical protein